MTEPRAVTRRAVVGTAVLVTTGCSLDSLDSSPDDPTFTPTSTPSATSGATSGPASDSATAEPSADVALVSGMRRAVLEAAESVEGVVRRHRSLREDLAPLAALHRSHSRELGGSGRAPTLEPVRGSARAARARVVRDEKALQRTLVRGAAQAESGPLARLLATMAASVEQHRAVL